VDLVILIVVVGYQNLSYNWQWYRIRPYFFSFENGQFMAGVLLQGFFVISPVLGLSAFVSALHSFV
jgi:polar amino acid transport system permease protein